MEYFKPTCKYFKKDVDLVDLKSANTIFKFQIVAKGIRVYGSDYEVEEFEMLTFSFYIRFKEERKIIEDSIIKGSNEGCYFKPRLCSRSLQRCAIGILLNFIGLPVR